MALTLQVAGGAASALRCRIVLAGVCSLVVFLWGPGRSTVFGGSRACWLWAEPGSRRNTPLYSTAGRSLKLVFTESSRAICSVPRLYRPWGKATGTFQPHSSHGKERRPGGCCEGDDPSSAFQHGWQPPLAEAIPRCHHLLAQHMQYSGLSFCNGEIY